MQSSLKKIKQKHILKYSISSSEDKKGNKIFTCQKINLNNKRVQKREEQNYDESSSKTMNEPMKKIETILSNDKTIKFQKMLRNSSISN